MDWFLYDWDLRHEKVKKKSSTLFFIIAILDNNSKNNNKGHFELFLLISETLQRTVEEPQAKRG